MMKPTYFSASLLLAIFVLTGCSYEPLRKSTQSGADIAADGRIKSRSSAENKKKVDYYNNLQHSGNNQR